MDTTLSPDSNRSQHAQTYQQESHELCNVRWLPKLCLFSNGHLIASDGEQLRVTAVPVYANCTRIEDAITWHWINPNKIQFRSKLHGYSLAPRTTEQFILLCDVIMVNYPAILWRPLDHNHMQTYVKTSVEWSLQGAMNRNALVSAEWPAPATTGHVIWSHQDIQQYIQRHDLHKIDARAMTHPAVTRLATIWAKDRAWTDEAASYKRRRSAAQMAALEAIEDTATTLSWRHYRNAAALAEVSWKQVHGIPGSTSRQWMRLYLLKANKISAWDINTGELGCPHSHCTTATIHDGIHIYWECPAAQKIWIALFKRWASLTISGPFATTARQIDQIFSLRLPEIRASVWNLPAIARISRCVENPSDMIHSLLSQLWCTHVLQAFQQLMTGDIPATRRTACGTGRL